MKMYKLQEEVALFSLLNKQQHKDVRLFCESINLNSCINVLIIIDN